MTEWSGIPAIIEFQGPTVTLEGVNTVMAQQSFRYLKKMFQMIYKDKKQTVANFGIFNYLLEAKQLSGSTCTATTALEFSQLAQIDKALKVCTAATVISVMKKISKSDAPNKVKTNHLFANDIERATLCHLKYVSFNYFMNGLESQL